jgi:ATP-dependent Lhr-like helicase
MFDKLDPKILEILNEEGIKDPTQPQKEVFETIAKGANVLLIVPTGTGKTEAAILPILDKLIHNKFAPISCIYITPLRALNRDLNERFEVYSRKLGINIAVRHGDTSQAERKKQSNNPPQLLITTPETLQILFTAPKIRNALKNVKYVIIDEVHELMQDERGAQLAIALERLTAISGEFQRIGLSATVGNKEELAKCIAGDREIEVKEVAIPKSTDMVLYSNRDKHAKESEIMGCDIDYGSILIEILELVKQHNVSLIFVNTRTTAEDIAMRYAQLESDIPISVHHGSLSQEVRTVNEEKLKAGELKALICTSSLELGIDVGKVDFVVQYNSPREVYRLIQRVGRSGHTLKGISKGMIISENPIELEEGMSIIHLAKKGFIENLTIRKNPIVVLANQIVSNAYSEKRVSIKEYYNTIHKTYFFKDLSFEKYLDLLEFLNTLHLVWMDDANFGTTRKALNYFYQNISLIPDEKSYVVIDISSNRFMGILDERFVASELEIGKTFVMKGMTWRVVDIKESKILVEAIKEISIPPLWVGEEIPVPFEVAMTVAELRDSGKVLNFVSEPARAKIEEWWGIVPAKNNRITIEKKGNTIVIEDYFGTRVNLTLAELISSLLAQKIGESVNISYSPYHISFETDSDIEEDELLNIIQSLNLEYIEILLKKSIVNSRFFKLAFYYVAKKFGIIAKNSDFRAIRLEKLMDIYKDTLLFEETVNKVFADYLDLKNTLKILKMINDNALKIEIVKFSKAAELVMGRYSENFAPIRLTKAIIEKVRERLYNEQVTMYCMTCHRSYTTKVKDIERIMCPYCSSVKVTMFQKYELDKRALFKKEDLDRDEESEIKRYIEISQLLRVYKRAGAMTMVAHGVGLETARRILKTYSDNELTLIKHILEAEIQYAKNRRFWAN